MKYIINWVTGLKWSTIIVGLIIIVGGFVFFRGGGSSNNQTLTVKLGDFTKQVFVSGTVKATQNVDMGFSQGGRISGVYVRVGDVVSQGKVLAEIENGDLRGAILQKQASLENEKATLLSLEQGTRPEELAVTESQVAKDEASLIQANQELINTIRDAYDVADDAVRNQVDQFISNSRSATPQVNFIVSDSSLKNKIESSRVVIEKTLSDWQNDLFALTLESDLDKAQMNARTALFTVTSILTDANSALNQGIGDQTTINGWIVDVSAARTSINSAVSSLTTAVTAQKNAKAALDISKKNLALDLSGSTDATISAQIAKVKAAEADVVSARAQLTKTLIIAPFSGVVTKVESKVGATASASSVQISLISDKGFEIESFVPEVDIAGVKIDDQATATLDAYGDKVVFDAHVVSIEPAETVRDGVSTYKTILAFNSEDQRIRSGMTANVIITTEKKTNTISIPQGVVLNHDDGSRYVFVRVNGEDVERKVEVGTVSSLGNIEILSGLEVGEEVVLSVSDK